MTSPPAASGSATSPTPSRSTPPAPPTRWRSWPSSSSRCSLKWSALTASSVPAAPGCRHREGPAHRPAQRRPRGQARLHHPPGRHRTHHRRDRHQEPYHPHQPVPTTSRPGRPNCSPQDNRPSDSRAVNKDPCTTAPQTPTATTHTPWQMTDSQPPLATTTHLTRTFTGAG